MWSRLTEIPSISINFKNRYILCDVYSTHVFTIIHVGTFHGSDGDFPASCAVASFKIWNHHPEANLIVVVLSTEDCCASSMKLWVPKKVILFVVYLSITLTLFILSTFFDKTIQEHHIYIIHTHMIVNVVLRFFDSRCKVSLTWDSNPRPSDFGSDALRTELASLTQGWSSTVDVYTRSDIEAHKTCAWLLTAR